MFSNSDMQFGYNCALDRITRAETAAFVQNWQARQTQHRLQTQVFAFAEENQDLQRRLTAAIEIIRLMDEDSQQLVNHLKNITDAADEMKADHERLRALCVKQQAEIERQHEELRKAWDIMRILERQIPMSEDIPF